VDHPDGSTRELALPRAAARALVLDADGHVLLFRVDGSFSTGERPLWILPGGGCNDGEPPEDAARRELFEEAGIAVEPADVGPCVWVRGYTFRFAGRWINEAERIYVVRLGARPDVVDHHQEAHERVFLVEHRWWSADEIPRCVDAFAPRRMAELLPPIIAGRYPSPPLDTGP